MLFVLYIIWSRCFKMYFVLPSLLFAIFKNVSFNNLITSVGEKELFLSTIDYS